MSKIVLSVVIVPVTIAITVATAVVAFAAMVSDYEVGTSHSTGKCQWVEKEGKRVPGGCKQVENGTIKRYSNTWVN